MRCRLGSPAHRSKALVCEGPKRAKIKREQFHEGIVFGIAANFKSAMEPDMVRGDRSGEGHVWFWLKLDRETSALSNF